MPAGPVNKYCLPPSKPTLSAKLLQSFFGAVDQQSFKTDSNICSIGVTDLRYTKRYIGGGVYYFGKPPLQMLAVARAERIDTMADAQRRRVEPSKVFLSFQLEAGVLAVTR
ncbi:MAG: hypothetical protein ACETWE_10775, partial [Candidatus Bathyarchaeia archaeon]